MIDGHDGLHADIGEILLTEAQIDAKVTELGARITADYAGRPVTRAELPERLGLPSLHTGYWDPFMAACEETGTVICLHVGSSSTAPTTSLY